MDNSTIKEYEELAEIRQLIEKPVFQKFIAQPLRDRQAKLKMNFFSDSLKESWRKGGKHEGLQEFFNILKQLDSDYKNKQFELEQSDKNI